MLTSAALSHRFTDKGESRGHISQYDLVREPEDSEAKPCEPLIPARIPSDACGVTAPIHFYDELDRWRHEICDEFADDDLAAKCHSKLAAAKLTPERSFDTVEVTAHRGRATFEQLSSFRLNSPHKSLPSPALAPTFEAHGAGCVTRPRTASRPRLPRRITDSPRRQRGAQRAPLRRSSAPKRARCCSRKEGARGRSHDAAQLDWLDSRRRC
jgi:hypothetical protein